MKKAITKVLSVLLVVTILATSLPFSTLAAEENAQNNQTVSTDMGDMSMTATNSFGEMLTESLSEQTNEQNAGYYISDIEYEGYCALVSFVTQQDCTIRVAIYEEDTGRMVTTASADVLATDTEAIVEFEDELPDYFVLKAFMLDEKVAPLCKAYTCNEMTKMYEDFMATTTEDFPEDKVINLDEDETNNFLVMSDDTTTVTTDDKTNVLLSYDSEKGIYTFGNIDEQITSLKKDDIFYFNNGNIEELTFIKVGAIDIDGTTAEITEAETSIEEVFDIVKIDNDMSSGDFVVDEDDELEDGVTYLGCEEVAEPDDEITTYKTYGETEIEIEHRYVIERKIVPEKTKNITDDVALSMTIKIEGNIGITVTGSMKYYLSNKFSEIELSITPKLSIEIEVDGAGRIEIELKALDYSPCFGVYIGIKPKFIVEVSAKIKFEAPLKFTLGFAWNTVDGWVNKSKKASFKPKIEVEGEFFVGVDLQPRIYLVSEKAAKIELESEIGPLIKSTMTTDIDNNHLCDNCIDGDINFRGKFTVKFIIGETTRWEKKYKSQSLKIEIKLSDFYYSLTYGDFGWGSCPYISENTDPDIPDNPGDSGEDSYDCDENGCSYTISTQKNATCTENGYVQYVCAYCGDTYSETIPAKGHNYQDGMCINCEMSTGSCGDNLTWIFDVSSGTLTISGTGEMYDDSRDRLTDNRPWKDFLDSITSVIIENGVISIGDYAFEKCMNLTSVTIPNSVTSIGIFAFERCRNLASITIPDSVTSIGSHAFYLCDSLISVTIPDGVTSIENWTFGACYGLMSVTIPDSVTTIGDSAFYYCSNLSNVTIPNSVTTIGGSSFYYCTSLTSVKIPDSVTSIDGYAFYRCYNLEIITIPDSVISIGWLALSECYSLTSITVDHNNQYFSSDEYGVLFNKDKTTLIQYPIGNARTSYAISNSVKTISGYAFYGCTNLTNVIIGNNVMLIDDYAFFDCNSLTSVTIPNSVKSIGYYTFDWCTSLTDVYYKGTEEDWEKIDMGTCTNTLFIDSIRYNSTGATYSLRSKQLKLMSFAVAEASNLTVYSATASNAISGNEYVILVLNSSVNVNNFIDDDILYIDQKTAETDSNITFNYVPKSDEECIVYIIGVFSDTNSVKQELITPTNANEPEYNYTFTIQTPSTTTIRHKDGIKLHAKVEGTAPDGSYVVWTASNGKFKTEEINNGNSLKIVSDSNGKTTFTATLYSADGEILATDSIEMKSKAGFFDKIGSFFRSLFGGTKIYEN